MRQVFITRHGPPEVLQLRESKDPESGPGEVRVRVRAAGINFADLQARVGLYPDAPKPPCVVGYEVSGVVDQVGQGVTGIRLGQRVLAMPRFGGYTDTLVLPAAQAIAMPERMSFEEGAALPVVYLTAHHMIFYTGVVHPGSRVLLHSAAGGVGLAAIQLLKTIANVKIYGTASPGKHDFLREQGVDHPFSPEIAQWPSAIRQVLGDQRLDLVLDPIGGRSFKEGYKLLGPAGRLVLFGSSAVASGKERNLLTALGTLVAMPRFGPIALMNENRTVTGVNMGHLFDHLDLLLPQFSRLLTLYEEGKIQPRVDKVFPLAEAAAAHHYLHDRKAKGKVLLSST